MENRYPGVKNTTCDDEDGERYLGDRDQIENVLGLSNRPKARKRTRAQISLQPQKQINSVLEETK